MNSELVFIDICCGLKGASQAARDRGWKVVTLDNDPRFDPDIITDANTWEPEPFHVDVFWASSVCTDFTKWGLPPSWACHRGLPKQIPDLTLTKSCIRLRDLFKPRYWGIENVRASREFLNPLLGPPMAQVPGHVIWGNLPCLIPQTKGHKWRLPPSPDRAAIRAKIPYEIGLTIAVAVERRSIELTLGVADGEVAAAGSAQGRVVVPANVHTGRS